MITVQYQDSTGNWRAASYTASTNNLIFEMKNAQQAYPNSRIRAVDENDRIVDIL